MRGRWGPNGSSPPSQHYKKAPFSPKAARIISIAKVAWQEVRAFGKEYGLSPASRTRISAPNQQPKQDTDEDFLAFGDGRSA
jgi:phage terminase small subunit